jgi:hypothetical protein
MELRPRVVLRVEDVTPLHPDVFANSGEPAVEGIGIGRADSDRIGLQRRKLANRFDDQVAVLKLIPGFQQSLIRRIESYLEVNVSVRLGRARHDCSSYANARLDHLQTRRPINVLSLVRWRAGRFQAPDRTGP